ncbi:MAG TPA: site-specific DNA-methyltransferase [Gemmata sp.]
MSLLPTATDPARIAVGDCLETLRALPDCSIHCCVTSPPYYGLRDYGHVGQIGLEPSPVDYVEKMIAVFREVRRVLRDDGTLWLNLGDSYSAHGSGAAGKELAHQGGAIASRRAHRVEGMSIKQLLGMPWRVAFGLQSRGWILRQDIIWAKPNPMPESVRDRCTKAHEYLFLLSKSPRYYFDAEAIKEPAVSGTATRVGGRNTSDRLQNAVKPQSGGLRPLASSRNKRSVWPICPKPYKGAHFAVMPEGLIEPCILAGTSGRGCCPKCGAGWVRVIERERVATRPGRETKATGDTLTDGNRDPERHVTTSKTIGWEPDCKCEAAEPVPAVVLDPFGGSGTVGLVARRLNRLALLCELNPEYADLARGRCGVISEPKGA